MGGIKLECQFPGQQGATPVEGTCCSASGLGGPDGNADDRCDSDPDLWTTPVWSDLKFQISDEHYFIYSFDSEGALDSAVFTATANADLDSYGLQTTIQRIGFGDLHATKAECGIHGSAAFFISKETE